LPTTRHRYNLDVWAWGLAQSRGYGQWAPLNRETRQGENNEDLIFKDIF